jgi:putative membrane protein
MGERARRLLILAVDIDNDLGRAGIDTPLIGREAVLKAATNFALYDPEDSDANVLFAAVKIADELKAKGFEAEPAVVAGSEIGGVEAGIIARSQVEQLVEQYNPDGIVLVSDGSEDEMLIPLISSIRPIYAVHRIVVKQHRGVEETYMLIWKFARKVLTEPRFSKLFLGVPGIILIVVSVLALMNMLRQALLVALLIAGLAMVVRGFDLEDKIVGALTETPVTLAAYIVAGISAGLAIGLAFMQLHTPNITADTIASAIRGTTALLGFAASIAILGHAASKFISGTPRLSREITGLAITVAAVALANTIADAIQAAGSLEASDFIAALVKTNFHIYAIASVIGVAAAWRIARALDKLIARTSSPSSETK